MVQITPYLHFKQKLLIRHGLIMTKPEYQEWGKRVHHGDGRYHVRNSPYPFRKTNDRSLVKIPFKGHDLYCIYSTKRRGFITVISKAKVNRQADENKT